MAPTPAALLHRLKSYYSKDAEKTPPVITSEGAAILSIAYTLTYVLPFYISAATRPSPTLSRDAPSVIRARIRAVTLCCVFSSLTCLYLIVYRAKASPWEALKLLGWWPIAPTDMIKSLLLTAVLFTGPLFEKGIAEGEWRDWIRGSKVAETLHSWIGWRNFIAGPITEELIFRSLIIPLHLLSKLDPSRIVFSTPLYFGIAHIHHFYEYRLTHPHTSLATGLFRSIFQFAYTTIFGWYAAFVFLRTGSLPAVIVAHSFCNWCGLPRLWGRVEAGVPIGPLPPPPPPPPTPPTPAVRGKEDQEPSIHRRDRETEMVHVAGGSLGVAWTLAYYILLVGGAVVFWKNLWTLTESNRALTTFH